MENDEGTQTRVVLIKRVLEVNTKRISKEPPPDMKLQKHSTPI